MIKMDIKNIYYLSVWMIAKTKTKASSPQASETANTVTLQASFSSSSLSRVFFISSFSKHSAVVGLKIFLTLFLVILSSIPTKD